MQAEIAARDVVSQEANEVIEVRCQLEELALEERLMTQLRSTEARVEDAEARETLEAARLQMQASSAEARAENAEARVADLARRVGDLAWSATKADEQETELSKVYEEQAIAHARQKEQFEEASQRATARWQEELIRMRVERDNLTNLVRDFDAKEAQGAKEHAETRQVAEEQHRQALALASSERSSLEETLTATSMKLSFEAEEVLRLQNAHAADLQRLGEDFSARLVQERQKEKDRSITMLKRKDMELRIKDEQLRGALQRLGEHGEVVVLGDYAQQGSAAALAEASS